MPLNNPAADVCRENIKGISPRGRFKIQPTRAVLKGRRGKMKGHQRLAVTVAPFLWCSRVVDCGQSCCLEMSEELGLERRISPLFSQPRPWLMNKQLEEGVLLCGCQIQQWSSANHAGPLADGMETPDGGELAQTSHEVSKHRGHRAGMECCS